MKKILSLSSLLLLGAITLTGCSCFKDGTYSFSHVEYTIDGKTHTTDCENTENLGLMVKAACAVGKLSEGFTIDGNKMYSVGNEDDSVFIKIEDGKLLTSDKEDGEYKHTGTLYKNGKVYVGSDGIYTVFAK